MPSFSPLIYLTFILGLGTTQPNDDACDFVESSFVVAHRVTLVYPGPADIITDSKHFNVTVEVSLDRWPVQSACGELRVPIVLDGKPEYLRLPSDDTSWPVTIINFCRDSALNTDNCGWLSARVKDLEHQVQP